MGDLTKNFSASEFECPCCGKSEMQKDTVARLQRLRTEYGKSFRPVEGGGYRCEDYDGKKGIHTIGQAIDPGIPREDMYIFMVLAVKHGFTGIGMKQKGGRWQMHIDDYEGDVTRPRPWLWTY
jgi:zinc D-Ala-D-Ala carboxypeptidase